MVMEERIQEWLKMKKEQVDKRYCKLSNSPKCVTMLFDVALAVFYFFSPLKFQEKQQKLKQSKGKEEIQRQQEKQREIEQKAQQKYQNWLQRKNQEKSEMEKREKVILAIYLS